MSVKITGRNRYTDEAITTVVIRNISGKALLEIEGGYIEKRNDTFVIAAKHPTATDEEGDSSYVVLIEGAGLAWKDMYAANHTFSGVLLKAKWITDEDATEQIEEQGYLKFTPLAQPWKPAAYIIEVEHSPVPINVNRLSPVHPLESTWKPGERVEAVHRKGSYGPTETRPGTVDRIARTYGYHESLIVAFDDGETRAINPDVMRHMAREEV